MRTSYVVNYYVKKVGQKWSTERTIKENEEEEEEGKDNKKMFNKTREYKANLISKVVDH